MCEGTLREIRYCCCLLEGCSSLAAAPCGCYLRPAPGTTWCRNGCGSSRPAAHTTAASHGSARHEREHQSCEHDSRPQKENVVWGRCSWNSHPRATNCRAAAVLDCLEQSQGRKPEGLNWFETWSRQAPCFSKPRCCTGCLEGTLHSHILSRSTRSLHNVHSLASCKDSASNVAYVRATVGGEVETALSSRMPAGSTLSESRYVLKNRLLRICILTLPLWMGL